MTDLEAQFTARLAALDPEFIDIADDSAAHAGHAGAAGGAGHYRLTIVSPHFRGLSRIDRHRRVYHALADLFPHRIHALNIHALSPDEI
ncbi:BolA family protein [Paludibacterium paludis]|uniref:BolA family transcriptional regulator n=1 Tax=Paludibacterium paludis TaxID=1225769 RepID=A0A918UAZ8_9NEIS|nr:BolA family protein [Paludibacterium paludis]GGY19276.1 hypothetical protein GCM10011289_23490 [Paludibacterium paludis]